MEYVGLRWYKCDFHLHTMSSPCYKKKDDTVEEWLDAVKSVGLECIAVTDHNDYRKIDEVCEKADKYNITVFPGVEVTCDSSKIHVLVLFDPSKTGDDVHDFLSGIGIKKNQVIDGLGTEKSIFDVCKMAKEDGCLVIPAHIDEYNGINVMSDTNIKKLLTREYVDAVQVVNDNIWKQYTVSKNDDEMVKQINKAYGTNSITKEMAEKWYKTYKKALATGLPMIMSSDNPCAEYQAEHGTWGIGRTFTWVKMDQNPNLEGIRQAFLSYEDRIITCEENRNFPYTVPGLWIKSIKINNTILNPYRPISVDFNPQLNCIIGGRGSGKSSIIRTITGGLEALDAKELNEIAGEQSNFYKLNKDGVGVLQKDSIVQIELVRNDTLYRVTADNFGKNGSQFYKIEKFVEGDNCWEPMDGQFLDLLKAKVYTQKQIYELAKRPDALSEMIDSDLENIGEYKKNCQQGYEAFVEKIRAIREANAIIQNENKVKIELDDINEQIKTYKKSGITTALDNKMSYSGVDKIQKDYVESIEHIYQNLKNYVSAIQIPDFDQNKVPDEINVILSTQKQWVKDSVDEIKEKIKDIEKSVIDTKQKVKNSQWHTELENAEIQYEKARKQLEAQGISAGRLDDLLSKQKNKQDELTKIEQKKLELPNLIKEKASAEVFYESALTEIRVYRQQFVDCILNDNNDVKIEYLKKKSAISIKNMLKKYIKSNGVFVNEDINKLAEIAVKKNIGYLRGVIEKCRNEENVNNISNYFKKEIANLDSSEIDQIMAFIPEDKLLVSYRPSGNKKFKPLNTASAGQKTTAILTFVLAYGQQPLLLDQPEDDLDNRLVYDLVVKRLIEAKKQRQIIVVTHNANIPVNGDADYITSMDSESEYVKVKHVGTMDSKDIRDEVCDVMEGTESAFEMRAKKYHLNITE